MIDEQPKVILLNVDESCECTDGRFSFVKGDARAALRRRAIPCDLLQLGHRARGRTRGSKAVCRRDSPRGRQLLRADAQPVFSGRAHYLTLGLQFLPFAVKRRLLRWCSVWGLVTRPDQQGVDEFIRSIRLLSVKEMKSLFPDAKILVKRFLFMPKSIIAIKVE